MTERLAAVNLQDDGDEPVKGFSGGMVCSRPACPIAPCCRHVTPHVPLRHLLSCNRNAVCLLPSAPWAPLN